MEPGFTNAVKQMTVREMLDIMEKGISDLVNSTLSSIRALPGKDHVMDDENGEFRQLILQRATNRFSIEYSIFVIEASVARDLQNEMAIVDDMNIGMSIDVVENIELAEVKIEPVDDDYTSPVDVTNAVDNINPTENCGGEETSISMADFEFNETKIKFELLNEEITEDPTFGYTLTPKSNDEPISKITEPSTTKKQKHLFLDGLMYFCVYCEGGKIKSDPCIQAEEVHKHWLMKHAHLYKPFQFYVGSYFMCGICKEKGVYHEVKDHFKRTHSKERFFIRNHLDENKCGICEYKGNNLSDHFRAEHKIIAATNVFNPIQFSKSVTIELSSIEIHKKFKCKICDEIFDTKQQILDHHDHTLDHEIQKLSYDEFFDKTPPYFICSMCNEKMDKERLPEHFAKHNLKCLECDSFTGRLFELAKHIKIHKTHSMDGHFFEMKKSYYCTKVVYGNGLVLNNYNLLNGKCDAIDEIRKRFELESRKKSRRVSFNVIEKSLYSPRSSSSQDISDHRKIEQLELLNSFNDTLVVCGLSIKSIDKKSLTEIFKNLCEFIEEPLRSEDIKDIYWVAKTKCLTVNLNYVSKRNRILAAPRLKGLKDDDFLQIKSSEQSRFIHVSPKITSFYERLMKNAKQHKQNRRLYEYQITNFGLGIRLKPDGPEIHVKSCRELDDCVEKFQRDRRKRKDSESHSTSKKIRNN